MSARLLPGFDTGFVYIVSAFEAEGDVFDGRMESFGADAAFVDRRDGLSMFLEAGLEEERGLAYEI